MAQGRAETIQDTESFRYNFLKAKRATSNCMGWMSNRMHYLWKTPALLFLRSVGYGMVVASGGCGVGEIIIGLSPAASWVKPFRVVTYLASSVAGVWVANSHYKKIKLEVHLENMGAKPSKTPEEILEDIRIMYIDHEERLARLEKRKIKEEQLEFSEITIPPVSKHGMFGTRLDVPQETPPLLVFSPSDSNEVLDVPSGPPMPMP